MTLIGTRTSDPYRTRAGAHSEIVPRTDPVVWQGTRGGPATEAELAEHDRNGFHVVPALLSGQEVLEFRAELDRMTADERVRADERTVIEPNSDQVRSIFDVHRLSDAVAKLVAESRVADRARQILGSEVYVHQSRINTMPGFAGTGFYWHSDFETWHAEDGMPAPRAVSASIALTDNYPFNGGLMLMPGAHREYVRCAGETPRENYQSSLVCQRVGVPVEGDITRLAHQYGIDQFTGEAGSALWFDSNSMHASGNNITPYPRANIFVVFNSAANSLGEPFAAQQRRPEFVASRDFTPVGS